MPRVYLQTVQTQREEYDDPRNKEEKDSGTLEAHAERLTAVGKQEESPAASPHGPEMLVERDLRNRRL